MNSIVLHRSGCYTLSPREGFAYSTLCEADVKPPRIPVPVKSKSWGIVSHGIQPGVCGPVIRADDGGCFDAASLWSCLVSPAGCRRRTPGTLKPASTRLSASMIWLSKNLDFFGRNSTSKTSTSRPSGFFGRVTAL